MKLLTTANPKIIKGEKLAVKTAMLSLAPHTTSGYNVCPKASDACTNFCLYVQGRGKQNSVQSARIKKTQWLKTDPKTFKAQLQKEIRNFVKLAKKQNPGRLS